MKNEIIEVEVVAQDIMTLLEEGNLENEVHYISRDEYDFEVNDTFSLEYAVDGGYKVVDVTIHASGCGESEETGTGTTKYLNIEVSECAYTDDDNNDVDITDEVQKYINTMY